MLWNRGTGMDLATSIRPPLPVVPYIASPPVVLSFFIALRPGKYSKIGGCFLYSWWCLRGLRYTTGDTSLDYVTGCVLGCQCLYAVVMLLLSDPVVDWHHETDRVPIADMPLWKRFVWILCGQLNVCGVGWNFQVPMTLMPPGTTRFQFITRNFRRILRNMLLVDLGKTYMELSPFFRLEGDEMSLWSEGPIKGCFTLFVCILVPYGLISVVYDLVSSVSVILGIHEPRHWPDLFGHPRDAYTIRRFWSRVWHQMLRRFAAPTGKHAARAVGCRRGSWLSARIQLLIGFSATCFAHAMGDIMLDPRWAGASVPVFLWQVLGITFEDLILKAAPFVGLYGSFKGRQWVHILGWVWVASWLCFSCSRFVEWTFRAGIANYEFSNPSVVKPFLQLVTKLTGVDLVAVIRNILTKRF